MSDTVLPDYSGWRPRSMRIGRNRSEPTPKAKRERLGPAYDRFLYKHAHGPTLNPTRYAQLCKKADGNHGMVREART